MLVDDTSLKICMSAYLLLLYPGVLSTKVSFYDKQNIWKSTREKNPTLNKALPSQALQCGFDIWVALHKGILMLREIAWKSFKALS